MVNGAGAAGIAVTKLLMSYGLKNVIMCDRDGALYRGKPGMTGAQAEMTEVTNLGMVKGTLADAIVGADVFFGFSAPGCLKPEMVSAMAEDSLVYACANPTPEIFPDEAKKAGARVVGTGRSDYPNQINNVLVFPGLFRGTLDVRASIINNEMKIAAAKAIASYIKDEELNEENIIPSALDKSVSMAVAAAVAKAARETGVARI